MRNPRIQIPCTTSFYKRVEQYQADNNLSSIAEAGRELIEFALIIKERADKNTGRSNRELLEEMLAKEYQNESTLNQIYMQVSDIDKKFDLTTIERFKENLKGFKERSLAKFDNFMSKKE